jgi:hypothetical protein
MVSHFNKSLSELERVDKHQFVLKIEWNFETVSLDVLVSIKKDVVCILIITDLLLFLVNVNGNLNCLLNITNCSVKFEGPLRLFWNSQVPDSWPTRFHHWS